MVKSLGDQWDKYARKWVDINAQYPLTRTAAAIDSKGYWYINKKTAPVSHTADAHPLPGYDSTLKEDHIMGPGDPPSFGVL